MGGAGARTFKKWSEVRQAIEKARLRESSEQVDAYVVCNGDESEPGTFKDREILLRMPHLVVEGVVIAGLLLEAKEGFIYIRHEYHEQIDAVRAEIERAQRQQLCGENILGTDISFPVNVVVSPGGYICGEQTALIEAMEDKRAEPRNRPPALQENGLYDQPTLLNNVETFAWVPAIVSRDEGNWYAEQGVKTTDKTFQGLRLFSVSGDVNRPGVVEVPNGIRLGELIDRVGGLSDGLQAAALSGPSGGFLPRKLRLDFVTRRLDRIPQQLELCQHELIDARQEADHLKEKMKDVANDSLNQERFQEMIRMTETVIEKLEGKPRRIERMKKSLESLREKMFPNGATEFDLLELELDKEYSSYEVGYMLGAGIVIYGKGRDLVAESLSCLKFYRNESCGKCVPCRIGSQKLVEIGTNLLENNYDGPAWKQTRSLVDELSSVMIDTSICGLGQVASNPVNGAHRTFSRLFAPAESKCRGLRGVTNG